MPLTSFLHDSHEKIPIHEGWSLSLMSGKPGVPADSMRKLSARVPGCVHLDLMRAGKIPDPYVGMNEKDVAWVAECDWSYVTRFKLGESALPGGGPKRLPPCGCDHPRWKVSQR